MCGRLPVVATSAGGFGAIGHPWSGMLLFVRSVRFLWRGSLGSGAGAAEAGVGYVSYGDWPCGIRCTFGGVSRSNLGPLP